MNMKSVMLSALMFGGVFSSSYVVAYDSGNPTTEITKSFFEIIAGGTVVATGAIAGGTVGLAVGTIGGALAGLKQTDSVAGAGLGAIAGGVAGAAAGGTAGAGIGLVIVKAFYDETHKNDADEVDRKKELKKELKKRN